MSLLQKVQTDLEFATAEISLLQSKLATADAELKRSQQANGQLLKALTELIPAAKGLNAHVLNVEYTLAKYGVLR